MTAACILYLAVVAVRVNEEEGEVAINMETDDEVGEEYAADFVNATKPKRAVKVLKWEDDKNAVDEKGAWGTLGSFCGSVSHIVMGCNVAGQFCCDSWMTQFLREAKSNMHGYRVWYQLRKWAIRPNKDMSEFCHQGAIYHEQRGKIGKDTHYFTVVRYGTDKYAVFDTVTPCGRDVSSAFDYDGNEVDTSVLHKGFSFERADDPDPKTADAFKVEYDDEVVQCVGKWMKKREWIDQKHIKKSLPKDGCINFISF